jgi:3-hydroxybutyryl-CoA dehydrogenase
LLTKADFVVENVVEKWGIKKDVYAQMDAICPENCILAANTSAISITRIGSATKRADKVIGMHFMNPVPMKKTVELIRGYHTSDETVEISKKFLAQMGKDCIIIRTYALTT